MIRIGQRVKWSNPENHAWDEEVRGRVLFTDDRHAQVMEDGKAFGRWLPLDALAPESQNRVRNRQAGVGARSSALPAGSGR